MLYALLSVGLFSPAMLTGHALSPADNLWFVAPWASSRPASITRAPNFELSDELNQFEPWLRYAANRFPSVPLWNSYEMNGRPFIGNAQSAVFSPFTLPAYLFPFGFALGFIAALKTWMAAFGMFLFARALRMRPVAAMVAGAAYGFNLLLVAYIGFPHSSIWALLPWLLFCTEIVVRRPTRLAACGLAGVTAAQYLCGHPEQSFWAMLTVVAYATLRITGGARRRSPRGVRRSVVFISCALAGGAALAAVAILPFVEALGKSIESSTPPGAAGARLPFKDIVALMTPYFEGGGSSPSTAGLPLLGRFIYIGALPLLLTGVALVGRRSIQQRWIAAFGLFFVLVPLGVQPLFSMVRILPGFHQSDLRRVSILTLLVIALLAGFGADLLGSARLSRRRSGAILIGWLVVMAVAPVWVGLPKSWSWLVVSALAGGLVFWRLTGGLGGGRFEILALALTAANLLLAGIGFNPTAVAAVLPPTNAIAYLQRQVPARFVAAGAFTLPPDVGMNYGLFDARSYDAPTERRYYTLWRTAVEPWDPHVVAPQLTVPRVTAQALRALNLLSVTNILVAHGAAVPALPGLRLVYSGRDADIYANDAALPRAFLVASQRVVAGERGQLLAVESPAFDGRRSVVVDHPLVGMNAAEGRASEPTGSASITAYAPEQVRVLVHANRPSVLVLTDDYFPGWTASVNGHQASIARVDYLLRGVRVGGGTSTVTFRYEPASWRAGWIVSLIAFVGWLGVLISALIARRRSGSAKT